MMDEVLERLNEEEREELGFPSEVWVRISESTGYSGSGPDFRGRVVRAYYRSADWEGDPGYIVWTVNWAFVDRGSAVPILGNPDQLPFKPVGEFA